MRKIIPSGEASKPGSDGVASLVAQPICIGKAVSNAPWMHFRKLNLRVAKPERLCLSSLQRFFEFLGAVRKIWSKDSKGTLKVQDGYDRMVRSKAVTAGSDFFHKEGTK